MARHGQGGLPESAQKVFDGEIFDVYQWEQELYDGTKAKFERLKRDDTGIVIAVTSDKKIIMLHQEQPHKPPFFGLPGGRLEPEEDPLQGTRRELVEETGYDSEDWELFYQINPASKIDWTVYCYIARNCEKKSGQRLDAGEKIDIELLDFDKFMEKVLDDSFTDWEIKVKILKAMVSGKIQELKDFILQ